MTNKSGSVPCPVTAAKPAWQPVDDSQTENMTRHLYYQYSFKFNSLILMQHHNKQRQ